jgi:hypothetical protein
VSTAKPIVGVWDVANPPTMVAMSYSGVFSIAAVRLLHKVNDMCL